MTSLKPLEGQIALVTGASRGIGRAIALRLARDGAAVAINYRTQQADADSLVAEIQSAGGRAILAQADVAVSEEVARMANQMKEQLGEPSILINNAGVMRPGDLEDFDYTQMAGMRATNVDGLVNVTRAVIGGMKHRGFGRIVNLTSIAAIGTAMKGTTFYAATKAAVVVMTKRFAMDLGPYGITVNAIAPGLVMTDMVTKQRSAQEVDQISAAIGAKAMVGRVGKPEDIAHAVAFLASPDSGFITAQILSVDGGRMDYI
jgi:NAD(P)-dependent dehydrogenase (short-subunit alcohol dehydrogenase family)